MGKVIHFEIHASDLDAAVAFYQALFGWKIQRWGDAPYCLIDAGEGPGANGAIMQRQGPAPAAGAPVMGATIIVGVDDIDATYARGLELGAEAAHEKLPVPGMGWSAYLRDPDGNVFGLFQEDAEAK